MNNGIRDYAYKREYVNKLLLSGHREEGRFITEYFFCLECSEMKEYAKKIRKSKGKKLSNSEHSGSNDIEKSVYDFRRF